MPNPSQDRGAASGSRPATATWDETHERMRQRAHRFMGARRSSHTLQATALANEAYLRLHKHAGDPSDVRSLRLRASAFADGEAELLDGLQAELDVGLA